MSQELSAPLVRPMHWDEVWFNALLRPSVESYTSIVNDPNASPNRAYKWVAVCALIGYLIATLRRIVFAVLESDVSGKVVVLAFAVVGNVVGIICAAPFVVAFAVVGLVIGVRLQNMIAADLGGTGSYAKHVYGIAAFVAPLSIAGSVLGAIPYINLLGLPLAVYGIVLNVTATKAAHQLSWGRAVASWMLAFVVILLFMASVFIIFWVLLQARANTFSNIIQNI